MRRVSVWDWNPTVPSIREFVSVFSCFSLRPVEVLTYLRHVDRKVPFCSDRLTMGKERTDGS